MRRLQQWWKNILSARNSGYPLQPYGMFHHRGGYLFIDYYGAQWRVRPTCDPSIPLTISLEKHA